MRTISSSDEPAAPVTAMLLAAGRGQRMRPLTDRCPKPLLQVHGQALMHWHLQALADAGVRRVVINTAWLGPQIVRQFGNVFGIEVNKTNGMQLFNREQMALLYSPEGQDFGGALETAGGICRALPQLCPQPDVPGGDVFWVLAGDVYTPDFKFAAAAMQRFAASDKLAHLWLVPNPAHNPQGDFGFDVTTGLALNLTADDSRPRYTYSTIGLYRRALFMPPWCEVAPGNPSGLVVKLAPLLRAAMDQRRVSAELYPGPWTDVGTPQRLAELNAEPSAPAL